MKEAFLRASSVIMLFVAGCLFGSYALYMHLRISTLEQQHSAFVKDVENFAKQVNEEFKKIKQPPSKK